MTTTPISIKIGSEGEVPKIHINSAVLKWAREANNLTLEEVAAKFGKSVSVEAIQAWEEGTELPTYIQLEKLAYNVYGRPIAVFFFPEPLQDIERQSFRTLPDFEYQRLSPSVIRLVRKAHWMKLNLQELCGGENPAPRHLWKDIAVPVIGDTVTVSNRMRQYLGLSLEDQLLWPDQETAFTQWRETFQNVGVFVFKDAFRQNDISGFCIYDEEFPIIFVNNSLPRTRQTFTLFHELSHLLLRIGGIDKLDDRFISDLPNEDKRIEIFCNRLAADILVPYNDFQLQSGDLRDFSDESIEALTSRYWVSREVILRRLLDAGKIGQDEYEERTAEWISQATQRKRSTGGGNYYATKRVYLGERYTTLVLSEYYNKRINLTQVAEYLDMKARNVSTFESTILRSR